MKHNELQKIYDDLQELVKDRLNVRARDFHGAVKKAGRLLPAAARAAAADLKQIETRLAHPKLAAKTDPGLAHNAADTFRAALSSYKPGARAARDRAFMLADIGVKVLVVICLILALIYMAGPPAT